MPTRAKFLLGAGLSVLAVVVQVMIPSPLIIGSLWALGISLIILGLSDWLNHFEYMQVEHGAAHKKALRFSFSALVIIVCALLFILHSQILSSNSDKELEELRAANTRYRRMLGIEGNTGKPNLIEMTNADLKSKARLLVKGIRDSYYHYERQEDDTRLRHKRGEIDAAQLDKNIEEIESKAVEEYHNKFRTEAVITLTELKNRVPPEKRSHLITLPDINPADSRDPSVNLYGAFPPQISFHSSVFVADDMEQLAALLPD